MGLDDQIRRISDELEIRNLLARMAHEADGGDLDGYISLFTEDAVWGGGPDFGDRRGHAAILEGARERRRTGLSGPGAHSRHIITTVEVSVDGDRASSRSNFMFATKLDGSPSLDVVGQYQDEFRRTPEGWKLVHRGIVRG